MAQRLSATGKLLSPVKDASRLCGSQIFHEEVPAGRLVPLKGLAHSVNRLPVLALVGLLQAHSLVRQNEQQQQCDIVRSSRLGKGLSSPHTPRLCHILKVILQPFVHRLHAGRTDLLVHVRAHDRLLVGSLKGSHGPALRPHKEHLLSHLQPAMSVLHVLMNTGLHGYQLLQR